MVTALRFGKPVPLTSSSAKGKGKGKEEEGKDDGGRGGMSRSREKERETAAATATATETASNNNNNYQKAAHNQRRQNLDSSSATNRVQCASSSASSTQLKVLSLPLTKNNTYAATQTQIGQKIKNGGNGPLVPTDSACWRPLTHDKAKGSINSNGGNFRVSAPSPSAAAAPTHTKAIVAKHKMSEEEEWIKTFNDVREYQHQHGPLPSSGWDNGKRSVEEVDLLKWMDLQRYLYQKYLEGKKSALSHTRIDLLRSIGMIDKAVSKAESKRVCMFWGCKRELGEYESFHCAEHRNVNTTSLPVGDPSTYNTSKRAVKRRKANPKESSSKLSSIPPANGTKHTLKSPPEEMLKNDSNQGEATNIKEDDILKMVKLAAGAVAKEIRYLGLHPSSSTDHVESAIERFAVEVYCPLLYSSKERSLGTSSYSADRVLLSVLLALQEMLVTNAETFFPLAGLKDSSTETDIGEKANSKLTGDFARALVLNAAKRLQRTPSDVSLKQIIPNLDGLVDRYLEASRRYESRGEDFQLALGRLDASATYRNAKGSTLSGRESIMARTSFNFAREHHPLIQKNDMLGGQPGAHPAPNACAIFVMGENKSFRKEDTMQTSVHDLEERHQKRTKMRESRIRLLKRYFGGPT